MPTIKLAIFASGSGSNAIKIIEYFKNHSQIKIELIATNNAKAGILEKVKNIDIPFYVFNKEMLQSNEVLEKLIAYQIDGIILAGFLALIPLNLIKAYPNKIINIHPALLPKYGGKGMYGSNVHRAVFANKETSSGLTIHLVNEEFDKGKVLFQASTNIVNCNNPDQVQKKVLDLEHRYFARVIESYF